MQLYKERLLSASQLKRLGDHKYSFSSESLVDPWLQPWWCWLVAHIPLWLAPNLITIVGLIVNVVTTLILVWYSPDARSEPPRWACALCALGLFVYQSLDAIDGKQARRTGSSSPLGELFDHGCDSISTVFVALSACISIQLGNYPMWMFFQCFCALTLFYCAHWQTYVSGTLKLGKIDVTEAQFTIIGIHLLSAVFGSQIWTQTIAPSFELRYLIAVMTIAVTCYNVYNVFSVILAGGVGKNGSTVALPIIKMDIRIMPLYGTMLLALYLGVGYAIVIFTGGIGKNGSTVAGTSILSPVIPFSLVIVPAFIIYQKSESLVYENHPALYIIAFGLVCAKVTNRLVVAHMTKSEMEYLDWSLFGPAMLFMNQYFNTALPEYYVLWMCLLWVSLDLFRYCGQICLEICAHLHIQLFTIPYPPPSVKNTPSQTHSPGSNSMSFDKNAEKFDMDRSDCEDYVPLIRATPP